MDLLNLNNKNNLNLLIVVLIVFIVVLSISGIVGIFNKIKENKYIGQEVEVKNTITVSDSAEKYVKPDLAMISFSVVTEAKTAKKASQENTETMNNVINDIKDQGVEEKDIKTTGYNIYPRYNYIEGERILAGYEINQSIQVKIRDLDAVGNVIQAAADAGANQSGNLNFTIDDDDDLREQVRAEAIKKAKVKAEKLADQLGVDLVRIVNFYENNQGAVYYNDYSLSKEAYGIGGGGATPNIETGENKIEVTVSISYEIN